MDLNGLLTFMALIIAVFALTPRWRRLNIFLKWSYFEWLILIVGGMAICVLQFYSLLFTLGLLPNWPLDKFFLSTEKSTFIIIVFLSTVIFLRLKYSKFKKRNIFRFDQLINELLFNKNYNEIISLVERHLSQIVKIKNKRYLIDRLRARLDYIVNPPPDYSKLRPWNDDKLKDNEENELGYFNKISIQISRVLLFLMPAQLKYSNSAVNLINMLFSNKELATEIARIRPYFLTTVIRIDEPDKKDIIHNIIKSLIADTKSILYYELRNNQNISHTGKYVINEDNRIIYSMFSDIDKAYNLDIWRPYGEYCQDLLDDIYVNKKNDAHNLPLFHEWEWESPIFMSIQLIDLMVSEALFKNIQWHMWLSYYNFISRKICRNYYIDKAVIDELDEFPTKYSYLLYRIISNQCNWLRSLKHIPPDQANIVLKSKSLSHENGNIIKSTILCLGQCLGKILTSKEIPNKFKQYMINISFDMLLELKDYKRGSDYFDVLLLSIFDGGIYSQEGRYKYSMSLITYFIHYNWMKIRDFKIRDFVFLEIVKNFLKVAPYSSLTSLKNVEEDDDYYYFYSKVDHFTYIKIEKKLIIE